jgi:hypothetical protein
MLVFSLKSAFFSELECDLSGNKKVRLFGLGPRKNNEFEMVAMSAEDTGTGLFPQNTGS